MLKGDKYYVRIRAFRAVDDPESCDKFIEGHKRVLTAVGVTQVSSSSYEWKNNPASYVIICESQDETRKVYGGARIHVLGGSQDLPIEEATRELDPSIEQVVRNYAAKGTGEFCGLWNSMEVAGMGIGAVYLVRCGVTILNQLNLGSCWALCSPLSVRISRNFGFGKYPGVGNEGTFYYPKVDLLATACVVEDTVKLPFATDVERSKIHQLRLNPNQIQDDENRGKKVNIEYDLKLSSVDFSVYER